MLALSAYKHFDDTRVFENVKPVDVITYLINMVADRDSIILDFFSGSATTAHAVMQLNTQMIQANANLSWFKFPKVVQRA